MIATVGPFHDTLVRFSTPVGELSDVMALDIEPFRGLVVVFYGRGYILTKQLDRAEWQAEPYESRDDVAS
jgi:hypothetical protein